MTKNTASGFIADGFNKSWIWDISQKFSRNLIKIIFQLIIKLFNGQLIVHFKRKTNAYFIGFLTLKLNKSNFTLSLTV